jgi:hypothetical protein
LVVAWLRTYVVDAARRQRTGGVRTEHGLRRRIGRASYCAADAGALPVHDYVYVWVRQFVPIQQLRVWDEVVGYGVASRSVRVYAE